ncbi:MAG: ABC transporter permease [Candidatus Acidiferrales bacterium]
MNQHRDNPPTVLLWLLRRCVPPRLRETVIGDLEEERRAAGGGMVWLATRSVPIAARCLAERARHRLHGRRGEWRWNFHQREGDGIMETLWGDVRYGARMLLKAPLFTAVAVLTLALGIGANTAIFSVVNAVVLQPLPLPDSDQLVSGAARNQQGQLQWFSYPDFQDLRAAATLLEGYSAFVGQSVNLTGRDEPQRVRGGFVSDNFFKLIGVEPAIGRGFTPGVDDEEGAERVCIVQHETWQGLFGGDQNFLGKTLVLNNEPFTVVGIMPPGFRFPFDEIEVWMPHHTWPVFRNVAAQGGLTNRASGLVGGVGRMKRGVTLEQAETEFKTIMARLSKQFPEGGERTAALSLLKSDVIAQVEQPILVLLGAVAFVLLIACANVANLMLARAAARQRELATRAALGAGRKRLVSQLLTETSLLWLAGGAGGLLLGWWGLQLLLAAAPDGLPGGIVARLDATVFAFALGVTALTGVLFGMIPALRFSSPNLTDALKEGGRGASEGGHRTRLRAALVVVQVALTLVLLAGSGLMLRSFQRLVNVDVGFHAENLLTMEYRLPQNKYPEGPQQWETHNRIIEQVRRVPGVRSAALVRGLPFSGNGGAINFEIVGQPRTEERLRARINTVDTQYFATMGIPLLRGRNFTEQDRLGSPVVAVINRYMADRFWPDQDPIGHKIRIDDQPPLVVEIIGVVGDTKQYSLDDPDASYIYSAQAQNFHIFNTIAARTVGDPMQLAHAVRAAVWSVDPDQPVWKIRTQASLVERSSGPAKFLAQLMGGYAALALLLAAVGIYGVMSYNVTQRTHEFGVRLALGAGPGDVLRMVLRRGLLLTGVGLVLGIAGALALGRVVQSLLFNTSASDPATLVAVALLLALVALLASYLPARRATRVDPLVALRYE